MRARRVHEQYHHNTLTSYTYSNYTTKGLHTPSYLAPWLWQHHNNIGVAAE